MLPRKDPALRLPCTRSAFPVCASPLKQCVICSFNIHCRKRWPTIGKYCCGSRDQRGKDAQCLPSALPVLPTHRPYPCPPRDACLTPTENAAGKAAGKSLLPHGFLDWTNAELSLTDTCTSPESLPASHQVGELHADKLSLVPRTFQDSFSAQTVRSLLMGPDFCKV